MKEIVTLKLGIAIIVLLCASCAESSKKVDSDDSSNQERVFDENSNQMSDQDKRENDTLKGAKEQISSDSVKTPTFFDEESVYQLHYEYYINKAYDRKTYEKHYKPYTYQSKHLDSLIEIYEKKKKEIENKEKSE